MKVICFGDSNTYGYDPRSRLGGRYDADSRFWPRKPAGPSKTWGSMARKFPGRPPAFHPILGDGQIVRRGGLRFWERKVSSFIISRIMICASGIRFP